MGRNRVRTMGDAPPPRGFVSLEGTNYNDRVSQTAVGHPHWLMPLRHVASVIAGQDRVAVPSGRVICCDCTDVPRGKAAMSRYQRTPDGKAWRCAKCHTRATALEAD